MQDLDIILLCSLIILSFFWIPTFVYVLIQSIQGKETFSYRGEEDDEEIEDAENNPAQSWSALPWWEKILTLFVFPFGVALAIFSLAGIVFMLIVFGLPTGFARLCWKAVTYLSKKKT